MSGVCSSTFQSTLPRQADRFKRGTVLKCALPDIRSRGQANRFKHGALIERPRADRLYAGRFELFERLIRKRMFVLLFVLRLYPPPATARPPPEPRPP